MKVLADAPMHTYTKYFRREVPDAMLQLVIIVEQIHQLVIV